MSAFSLLVFCIPNDALFGIAERLGPHGMTADLSLPMRLSNHLAIFIGWVNGFLSAIGGISANAPTRGSRALEPENPSASG